MEIKDNILIDVDELDIIEGTLIVPSDIIEIADSAFKDDQIIKVELPSSIKKIGVKAFSRLKKIKEVILAEGLIEIEDEAFKDCENLTKINIPTTVEKIGKSAFQNCASLQAIELPKSIKELGALAFSNCSKLTNVILNANVLELKEGTFENCIALKEIKLSNSINKIGTNAFKNNRKLNNLELPEHLKVIETNAFWGCECLKKVTFNQELEEIGNYAFGDTKLEKAELPQAVTKVGCTPFHMCYQLVTLKINKLFHNQILDETNTKLRELFLGKDKLEVLKPVKKIINYNGLIIIKYSDESFQVVTKPLKYYDKKYFETTFPQYNFRLSTLMKCEEIFNIYYWESILDIEKIQKINPITFVALPPNINTIKAYYNKIEFYNKLIEPLDKFDDILALIKFVTIFGGLCKKNNNIEKYISIIGIKNITKQFKNVMVKEFNQKFLKIYLKLLDNYSIKEINEIMPFLYNNIEKVSNSKINITIEDIETLQYAPAVEVHNIDFEILKSDNNSPNYEWLDTPNTVNLLWGFILGSVSERNINSSEQERTVRNYNIKDENGLIVASAHAYYNEEEKYLLFNSINLSQSYVTKGYDVEMIKKSLIDYVLASIEDVLNFLNEKDATVLKVHVGISEKNIREQLSARGTKIINQNI